MQVGNMTRLFNAVSYLQYPFLLIALFYVATPYFTGFDGIWASFNKALIFAGLAISFSTLQDTTKTQNNFSRRIWENPRKGKLALLTIAFSAAVMLLVGLYGFFAAAESIVKEVAFGMLMLGISYIGLLKSAIEMYGNFRSDRRSPEALVRHD